MLLYNVSIWPWARFFIDDIKKPPSLCDQIVFKLWMEVLCTLAVLHSTCRKSTIDWIQTPWKGIFWTVSLGNRRVAHHAYSDYSFHQRHAHDDKTKVMVKDCDESIRQCIAAMKIKLKWIGAGRNSGFTATKKNQLCSSRMQKHVKKPKATYAMMF